MRSLPLMAALAVLALAASCATQPVSTAPRRPEGTGAIPSAALALGPYRSADADAVARAFNDQVLRRYGAGNTLAQAVQDLSRQRFGCSAAPSAQGDPPDRVCRRVVREQSCAHTFSVLLYDDPAPGGINRARGLYDRLCGGGSGLLGGR